MANYWYPNISSGGSGSITGGGAAGQVTYWDGPSSITGNAALTFDDSNGLLTTENLSVLRKAAIGSQSFFGDGYLWTIADEVIDFSSTPQWSFLSYLPSINPSVDIDTTEITCFDFETFVPNTNTKNIKNITNFYYYIQAEGSGHIDVLIGAQNGTLISGTRTADDVYGYIIQSGHFGTAGSIQDDRTIYIVTPANGNGGTMDNHRGLYIDDQEFGTNSWAIQTHGGKVEFGAVAGKNSLIYMSDDNLNQPITSRLPANAYAKFTSESATKGGLEITGVTQDNLSTPLKFNAFNGSTSTSLHGVEFSVAKSNGGTGLSPFGATDFAYHFTTAGAGIFTIFGGGKVEFHNFANWLDSSPVTNNAYQIGRDNSLTNQLHFNVPTGAGFIWSINGVTQFSMASTGAITAQNLITASTFTTGSQFSVDDTGTMNAFAIEVSGYLQINGQFNQAKGADITAANDLILGNDGNTYVVSGNTQINAIDPGNLTAGSSIILIFSGTPTIKNDLGGGAGTVKILLGGSVDLTAAPSTVLTLVYDGSKFQQTALKTA